MNGLKIYMMTDLEGVSGVVEFEDRQDESPRNLALRQTFFRLLAGEVNAAIEGAVAAGAAEILVNDGHGGGYTIDFERLDPRVRVIHGRERPCWCAGLDETFDAMFFIGAHAMAGTRGGVLYHTWSAQVRQMRLCGRPVGEIGLAAFCAGAFGVPLVYVSGDTAACREAEALIPNITVTAVKEGLSRYAAISCPPAKARQMIAEGAQRALAGRRNVKPFAPPPPYTWQEDTYPDGGDVYQSNPADLPATWTTGEEVRADSPGELIRKVWCREV